MMALRRAHGTQHGGEAAGDALDLFGKEQELLKSAFAEWDSTRLDKDPDPGRSAAAEKYDNGTLGKLILEHTAQWLAAMRDIQSALSGAGRHDLEHRLAEQAASTAPLVGRVDKLARGVGTVSLAGNAEFVDALTELRAVVQPALLDGPRPQDLTAALGEHRRQLHSARWVQRHAPTTPSQGKWYDKVPFFLRLHTALDRGRGFPWAESRPMASPEIAGRYDQQVK